MLSVVPQISCSPASVKTLDFFYYTAKHKILEFYCPQLIYGRQVQQPGEELYLPQNRKSAASETARRRFTTAMITAEVLNLFSGA